VLAKALTMAFSADSWTLEEAIEATMTSSSWPDFAVLSMAISFYTHKREMRSLLNSGSGRGLRGRNCTRMDKDN
jgi:hypothetical protein